MIGLVFLVSVVVLGHCQDFVFPGDYKSQPSIETKTRPTARPNSQGASSTQAPTPVVDQDKCPGNQLYYPGLKTEDPWFCDCGPTYLYYRSTDECYLAYSQGPCPHGDHLVIEKRIVKCVRNPCQEGFAKFNGACHEIGMSGGPCKPIGSVRAVLTINPSTMKIECSKVTNDPLSIFYIPKRCPRGSKRDANDKCREIWNDYFDFD